MAEAEIFTLISNTLMALRVRELYPEYYQSTFRNYSPHVEEEELLLRILSDLFTVRFHFHGLDDPYFDSYSVFYVKSSHLKAMEKFHLLCQSGLSYTDRVASSLRVGLDWLYASNLYGDAMDVKFLKLHGLPYALKIEVRCYTGYYVLVECILTFFKHLEEAYRRWFCDQHQ